MAGILSKGITLAYGTENESTHAITYTVINGLQECPNLGGKPDKVETTTLANGAHTYINGIKEYGDLTFKFLYDNDTATSNYRVVRGLEEAGEVVNWEVEFPDGTKFHFGGEVAAEIEGAGINTALTFNANIALNTDITVVNPTTTGTGEG